MHNATRNQSGQKMDLSLNDNVFKRLMPARINLLIDDKLTDLLDAWRRTQKNPPSRPAALKHLVRLKLAELAPLGAPSEPPRKKGRGKAP